MDISRLRAHFEPLLGHPLDERDHRRFEDLLRVPLRLIDEARKLHVADRARYWEFYAGRSWKMALADFDSEVVDGGVHPILWGQGLVLIASPHYPEFLRNGGTRIRELLGEPAAARWFRVRPVALGESMGAPAVLRPELDYSYRPPVHISSYGWRYVERLEPVLDFEVAARRWIAHRLSALGGYNRPTPIPSARTFLVEVLHQLRQQDPPPIDAVCADAWIAATALVREWSELEYDPKGIPGFQGPDAWYEHAPEAESR